jgi:hypothetical protein
VCPPDDMVPDSPPRYFAAADIADLLGDDIQLDQAAEDAARASLRSACTRQVRLHEPTDHLSQQGRFNWAASFRSANPWAEWPR